MCARQLSNAEEGTREGSHEGIAFARRRGWTGNVLDCGVCGLQWVPAKLTHLHVFCLIVDKKTSLFLCYLLKALSTKTSSSEWRGCLLTCIPLCVSMPCCVSACFPLLVTALCWTFATPVSKWCGEGDLSQGMAHQVWLLRSESHFVTSVKAAKAGVK